MSNMENLYTATSNHLGRKVERIRRLRGLTQQELADHLKITKQAISKIEQTEKISNERLAEIAKALGVTLDGLKNYNEEKIHYYTYNFFENCGVSSSSIGASNIENINNFPIEQTIKFFEDLLTREKQKFKDESKSN